MSEGRKTARDYNAAIYNLPIDDREGRRTLCRETNRKWEAHLRPILKRGDRLRAMKAVCGSREATFTFDYWDGHWIKSIGGANIAPARVYSVNRKVIRL